MSEIARSLNENITLKKTIDRLSRNLSAFKEKETVMKNYISEVKKQINEENAVIIIDNSDITKPCSPKMEAISDVHDGRYRGNQKRIFYCGSCRAFTKQKNATPRLRKGLFGGRKRGYQCNTRESTMLEIIVCTFLKELCPNT